MRYLWLDIQYSAVILTGKRRDFEIQFYLIVLSNVFQEVMGRTLAVSNKEGFDNTLRCS